MEKLKHMDLFSGIGGFSLGLERTNGFETVCFVEIDPFCQKVLKKHWPHVPIHEDVRSLEYDGPVDIITGGFPCQDISVCGKLAGIKDGTRSGLWSEIVRITSDLRPRYLVVENVSNLLSGPGEKRGGWFSRILGDLASIGYDAEWDCIQPGHVGFPSIRDRVWICAYPAGEHVEKVVAPRGLSFKHRRVGAAHISLTGWSVDQRGMGRGADGLPDEMDRFESLGNSIYPQISEIIGHAILEAEK